ncbi:glutamate-5-semialdehyde dehydrogenase [Candidatus Magnetaquicoccus inordinatus]|uniref:glutamate-5-semialdehyde dehydrogenase n=1 Tax=Candidatus Magnetaquicoccus inordinatus TaxID=2496818 RepID=UPI00102B29AA|nr:glutamate-5-semialdehyde dehydrogenase [Candidatus Magnetaquicoccus inordinatus]
METSQQVNVAAMARQARQAARLLAMADGAMKNKALLIMAERLLAQSDSLQAQNSRDLQAAEQAGLSPALIDRLRLTPSRIAAMADGVRQVAALDDPVGEITSMKIRPNGLQIGRMRVPLGVIGVIYESRPNVTADAAALCVKSGNAVILRGGSEAYYSNRAISACLMEGLQAAGLPMTAIQYIDTTDRAAVGELLRCDEDVDVIIPRGGKDLIARIIAESHIPVIKHLDGICHTYIDADADLPMALALTLNGKMQRTGVCNATETLLVHRAVATAFLPEICQQLAQAGCELRVCPETRSLLPASLPVRDAVAEDWDTEYLDAILSIRVVASLDEAINHIETHSSRHTDVIVTRNHQHAMRFLREVDSSSVMVNASSRFSDGFEFGLGAEMGISTDKLHVRGPVGLEGLTTQKYIVLGNGQLRQ